MGDHYGTNCLEMLAVLSSDQMNPLLERYVRNATFILF